MLLRTSSASIAHARVCEGRGRRGYGNPYSGTKPETVDTCQGDAYGCARLLLLGADGSWLPKLKYLSARPSVTERPQLWKPFAFWNRPILGGWFGFACIARVKPGVSAAQALADLNAIQTNIANQARVSPTAVRGQFRALLVPLQEQIVSRSRTGLQLLLAAVAMVLVIGCVNVAHLLFARGSARHREMAIRRAIGATEGRLVSADAR